MSKSTLVDIDLCCTKNRTQTDIGCKQLCHITQTDIWSRFFLFIALFFCYYNELCHELY